MPPPCLFPRDLPCQGLERVKKSLFSRLHDIARVQMFPDGMVQEKKKEKDGKKRLA